MNDNTEHSQPLLTQVDTRDTGLTSRSMSIASTIRSTFNKDSLESTKTGVYSILVVCCAAIGGLLFGYDTGVISGVLVTIGTDLGGKLLTPLEKELITSITSVGALIGSIVAGSIADKFGRKNLISLSCVVFALAALMMGFSKSVSQLVISRFVVGLAVGGASMIVPVYIAEIAPTQKRGRLMTINSLTTTGGQLVAYLIAVVVAPLKHNWRVMFLLSGIPPVIFLLCVGFIPESPRFLLSQGKLTEATLALKLLYPNGTDIQVNEQIASIQADAYENRKLLEQSVWKRLFGLASTTRALIVVCGLMSFQQLCGFNALMYYSATIFQLIGISSPLEVAILVAGANFCFTFVAAVFVDKVGRRRMLLSTVWIMALALFLAAYFSTKLATNPSGEGKREITSHSAAIFLIGTIVLYVASYASASGTVPWSAAEILPSEARAPGATLVTMSNWTTNTVVSLTYLSLVQRIGFSGTFLLFGTICVLGWVGIYMIFPEVGGLPLETVRSVFEEGFGVQFAEELRQELKKKPSIESNISGSMFLANERI